MSIFITGATAGIGRSVALMYAKRGTAATRIVVTGRRSERLNALCEEIKSVGTGAEAFGLNVDVRDREAMNDAVASLPEGFSDVEVLVNNAGLAAGLNSIADADIADWESMIDTNCKGLLYTTKALIPGMIERKAGHIVNIGSVAGSYPLPNANVYCATKAFVNHLSLAMRAELYGTGVRVTSIEPGNTETEFSIVRFGGDKAKADAVYESGSGRLACTGEDIAEIVHFCTLGVGKHVNINRLEVMPEKQGFGPFAFDRS